MTSFGKRRSRVFVLLLFLTAQIVLPAFCCCGISTAFSQDTTATTAGESCPRCATSQADDLLMQFSGVDGSHECPCKARVSKENIRSTKATVQLDLPFSLDTVIHTHSQLDVVINSDVLAARRAGPTVAPDLKHSQTTQAKICIWLC